MISFKSRKLLIDRERFRWVVSCLEAESSRLNEWEKQFLNSMVKYLGQEERLSELQVEKVEGLYKEVGTRPVIKAALERKWRPLGEEEA